MEDFLLEGPWAKLVPTEGDKEDVVPIVGNRFSIGRKRDLVDYVIPNNKHVSGCHCILRRANSGGKRSLQDTSTNGTLLNGKRPHKDKEVKLVHNDIITIVQRKDDPGQNVVFRFEDLSQTDNDDYESTLVYEEESATEDEDRKGEGYLLPVGGDRKRPLCDEDHETYLPRAKIIPTSPPDNTDADPEGDFSSTKHPKPVKMDSIEQTLICPICQEILHDCVSLQPCMHSYCGGCYSEWMTRSSSCPACRNKVQRISKNHIVNNLVDAYLRKNPHKKRQDIDLKELDNKNKITHDMLYPNGSSSSSSSEEENPLSYCRQCPDFHSTNPLLSSPPTTPYPYTCTLSTNHVFCDCCYNPMPERTDLPSIVQRCGFCSQPLCHLYWICPGPSCHGYGCITLFKELKLRPDYLNGILGNAYESTILRDYLESEGLSACDFLQALCMKLDSGDYSCTDTRLTTTTNTCHKCAMKFIKELAYFYRRDIPNSALPYTINLRTDCYWGKECRTQYNKPSHAKKFNHICERTRNLTA